MACGKRYGAGASMNTFPGFDFDKTLDPPMLGNSICVCGHPDEDHADDKLIFLYETNSHVEISPCRKGTCDCGKFTEDQGGI